MSAENFINKYNKLSTFFEQIVDNYLGSEPAIHQAAAYSLSSGGKRLRPVLTLAVTEMLNLDLRSLSSFALAVELIHTSSLIHDDLPALDNDDFRRGKPTCHKVYGEAIALLSGDALISEAFRVISIDQMLSPLSRLALVELLSQTATTLCQGQILDLPVQLEQKANSSLGFSPEFSPEFAQVQEQYLKKTAALITAACVGPALTLQEIDCDKEEIYQALHAFGQNLGLLFQFTDDLLDARCVEEGDNTRVIQDIALECYQRAISSLGALGESGQFLADLAQHILERKS